MTQEPRQPASELIGEVQRWLLRTSARGVSRGLNDQIRTALRGGGHGDVWETATADEEPPECAWCPICRARRRLRESGPGLASGVAAATDAVGVAMQDALSAFEAAMAAAGRQARPRPQPDGEVWDVATDEPGTPALVEPGADGPAAGGAAAQPSAGAAAAPAEPAGPASAADTAGPGPAAGAAGPEPADAAGPGPVADVAAPGPADAVGLEPAGPEPAGAAGPEPADAAAPPPVAGPARPKPESHGDDAAEQDS